jgi:hypothetical protein
MDRNELHWWVETLHNYDLLEELSVAEVTRLILCCLEFIVKELNNDH